MAYIGGVLVMLGLVAVQHTHIFLLQVACAWIVVVGIVLIVLALTAKETEK